MNLCFYGAGSMAEAIVRGLIEKRVARPEEIVMINRQNGGRLQELADRYGVRTAGDAAARERALREAGLIVLGMKPKDAVEALSAARPLLDRQLIVSVIAGLGIATIEKLIGRPMPVARTMPNTSSTIGLGATGVSFSAEVDPDQRKLVLDMFGAVGIVAEVEESRLDIVTGVSGSGPAYIYYMMEAMIAGGIAGGLSAQTARELTLQTVLGAAQMVRLTGEDPADLRRKVTSPNGTTQAALETLDRHAFAEGVHGAVLRAAERAGEMGRAIAASAEQ